MNGELASHLESLHQDAFGWALHCCAGDHPRAQDVLQTAYLKLAQGRTSHDGRSSVQDLVVRRDPLHGSGRVPQAALPLLIAGSLDGRFFAGANEAMDALPTPSRQVELDEESRQMRSLLARLPARQSEVLHLVFYQDLTLAEAAGVMRVGIGSAANTTSEARRGCAQCWKTTRPPITMNDREIRDRFARLREADHADAPAYGPMQTRASAVAQSSRRHQTGMLRLALAGGAIAMAALLMMPRSEPRSSLAKTLPVLLQPQAPPPCFSQACRTVQAARLRITFFPLHLTVKVL